MAATQTSFRINNVRVAFPKFWEPSQFNGQGAWRCGGQFILTPDHPQIGAVRDAIKAAAVAKWGAKAADKMKKAELNNKVCLRSGDSKSDYDGFAGNFVLSANCKGGTTAESATRPAVFNRNPQDGKCATEADWHGYSGCYVNIVVSIYADDRFGDGINCSLAGVQFAADGDAFAGAKASASDFDTIEDGATAGDFSIV